jgi:lipopolysaccharide biosynthesis protein
MFLTCLLIFMSISKPKLLAFYLPQFHPVKENNDWWGAGFTEWTNVAQTLPRFSGHNQPQIPADLGFYDLRLPETRQEQVILAKKYGIEGFCYYHYWFNGKQILERPLQDVIKLKQPDFPFCICWANENWTRAWDGLDRQVLMHQKYSSRESRDHFEELIKMFQDDRYITIDNRPLLLIYRPDNIPSPLDYFNDWRAWAVESGLSGLYICAVNSGSVNYSDEELLSFGFDAIVDFQPNRDYFPKPGGLKAWSYYVAKKYLPDMIYQKLKLSASANNIIDYNKIVGIQKERQWPSSYRKFPSVFPSWDNSARRRTATIIQNNDPDVYREWLADAICKVNSYPESEQIVFINAWNEWAEGCHLEPDTKHGHAFLKATKSALLGLKA